MSKVLKSAVSQADKTTISAKPRQFAIAFSLVYGIIAAVFSTMVIILDYCFPGSLDGTYLKLFF